MPNRAQKESAKCRLENKESKIISKVKLHDSSSIMHYNNRQTSAILKAHFQRCSVCYLIQ